jgi:hypothetical protein
MKRNSNAFYHLLAIAAGLWHVAALAQPVGQWDFNAGDLSATVGGNPMSYVDGPGGATQTGTQFGSTTSLGMPAINGTAANVMKFPASSSTMGYDMPNPTSGNGGGSLVNIYTIVMDVLFPAADDGHVRPLVQTDEGIITPDADLVVDSSSGIGAPPGPYNGSIVANTWYRIGFSVTSSQIREFINGVEVGDQSADGLDGRFALTPSGYAKLFQNSTLAGAAPGYVSSIQIWNTNLNAGQMAVLGGPSASKIPTNITSIPSFIESRVPTVNATAVTPLPSIVVALNPGGTTIATNTIQLTLDGSPLATAVSTTNSGASFLVTATISSLLAPASVHTNGLVYSDSSLGLQTNLWAFTVLQYQNVTLPAPIYLETFDEVAQDGIPAGWVRTNWTDTLIAGLNLFDTQSDSYKNWTTIDIADYATVYPDTETYTSPGFPTVSGNRRQMIPPIVENGVLLTNLASGNLLVAESDQRDGSQVQVIFTSDYDLTGRTNVYLSFHHINEQNQDNICSVEYSIDHGTNWLPLLYMLDDGTTDSNGSDAVTNKFTGELDVFSTFNTPRQDQAHGKEFGYFIGAPVTTNLIPFIRPCRNDDPVQQKRIEVFRLPQADNQSAVRLRFMQAGTASWYFDIDNLGFYSINQPLILQQPGPVIADYNGPATFLVTAGGSSLSYQWNLNGTNIPGATASSYTIANTSSNSVGLYRVAVTNASGFALSDEVPLSLVFTPVITAPPSEQTVTVGNPVSFSITARGGQPLYYQWLLNSNAIPGAIGTNYSIASSTTNDSGYYQVLVSNSFSTVLSRAAKLTVFAGAITQDMVVHLTFDNTYADSSGHGNDGTPVNTPVFTNGFLGQAIHVNNNGTPANNPSINNYVTLGYPGDLHFGSDATGDLADFSFSFWTKIFEQNDDQCFIGNKNWDSGSNPGWVVASQGSGMKWNYRDNAINNIPGVGNTRRDSPGVAPQLLDGGWHHVIVTMARHSVGRIYVDGVLINEAPLGTDSPTNVVGSVDTDGIGWHVNIGQDGTGTYTDGGSVSHIDMLMDDVAIWRRVLTTNEAFGIFTAGLQSNTVDHASISFTSAPPTITLQPQDAGGSLGATVTLKVSALASPGPTYQWWFGNTLLTGETNPTYSITNMQAAYQGGYKVVVANASGSVTSRVATVTFLGAPSVTLQPASTFVSAGTTNISFGVTASGVTPLYYQWLKNGVAVPGATDTNLVFAVVSVTDQGGYSVIVSNSVGATNSLTAQLGVFGGSLGDNLVAYLPFDGDYKDYSPYHNNGTPVGSPSFAPGRIGQSLHFATTNDESVLNYVTLGYPASLQFGSNSFSVGFWINYTNQGDDAAFIGNKDWNSSGNVGWIVASQSSGRFRVQATGTGGTRMNTTSTPLIRDGNWHHILCTFWRAQFVSTYVDGQLINTTPVLYTGSVDTVTNGYAVNIGQDGTGHYTDANNSSLHIDGFIDEVMLWNRIVTPTEVAMLYNAGTNGVSPLPIITTLSRSGNSVTLNWTGGLPPFTIETKANITDTTWSTLGTTSNHSFTGAVGSTTGFVRVRGSTQ